MCVEGFHAAREALRPRHVVVIGPPEIRSRRLLEDPVVVASQADVVGVAHVADTPVPHGESLRDLLRRIGRGVVGDDELEVSERLRKPALDRLAQEVLPVEDGESDAHPG
jgi:hypothetical protein